ncbi:hypothetical protein BV25DRAFT_1832335 [Artomyces pyxidatus]|uniref:Uncharacterized protein n=1 Tax=Artomyces pyxidatus TaxID=48021 RepID=A0ACB8SIX5_9AGAM|nr:hypothetical protein BV25DRAFT_1832335 [Artomyces pyxidatus]
MPLLRSLTLRSVNIPWTSTVLDNLVNLTIESDSDLTASELYVACQRMPKLEVLSVEISSTPPLEKVSFPTVVIPMRLLMHLRIKGAERSWLDLASRLSVHRSYSTQIVVSGSDIHPFTHPMLESFGGAGNPPQTLLLRSQGTMFREFSREEPVILQLWSEIDKAELPRTWHLTSCNRSEEA